MIFYDILKSIDLLGDIMIGWVLIEAGQRDCI
jgi:hypothetical protein